MKFLKIAAILLLFLLLTGYGLFLADRGSKRVAGYLDQNQMLSVQPKAGKVHVTLFNSTFTIG